MVTVPSVPVPEGLGLLASSTAGIAYSTRTAWNVPTRYWVKAPGGEPAELAEGFEPTEMSGRLLIDNSGTDYTYWDGPVRSCSFVYNRTPTPTGWAHYDDDENAVMLTTAGDSGCSTRNFVPITSGWQFIKVGADENGLVVWTANPDDWSMHDLSYYRYDDPTRPVKLDIPLRGGDTGAPLRIYAGSVFFQGFGEVFRLPLTGGPRQALSTAVQWQTMTATHVAAVDDLGLRMMSLSGGPISTVALTGRPILSDGSRVYTFNEPDDPIGIYSRTQAAGPPRAEVLHPVSSEGAAQYTIALSPGRVHYTAAESASPAFTPSMRTLSRWNTVGPRTAFPRSPYPAVAASAGRFWFGRLTPRTPTGELRQVPLPAAVPLEASGNRVLVQNVTGDYPIQDAWPDLYDVRTGRLGDPLRKGLRPTGAQAIFANWLVYAKPSGTVWRRDLATGRDIQLGAAGANVLAVAVHGDWVAWVTGCPLEVILDAATRKPTRRTAEGCPPQRLTVRNLASGFSRTWATGGTYTLDLSGGYLALDTWVNGREVRTISLPAGVITVRGDLHANLDAGAPSDLYPQSLPRHFDLDDESLGWIGFDRVARVAKLAPFVEPPIYLGNVIAPTAFSPNGDGTGDTWTIQFPVSKAMPTCTVEFYSGAKRVRTLSCANTSGMATATWDGRNAAGAKLAPGSYGYRVNGYDSDGWLRHTDLTLKPATGSLALAK